MGKGIVCFVSVEIIKVYIFSHCPGIYSIPISEQNYFEWKDICKRWLEAEACGIFAGREDILLFGRYTELSNTKFVAPQVSGCPSVLTVHLFI